MKTNWAAEATRVADYLKAKMFHAHRGAFALHDRIVIAFGNRGPGEVPFILKTVAETFESSAVELGSGFSSAGMNSWAIIFRVAPDHDPQELASVLNIVVWTGAYGRRETWSDDLAGQFEVQIRLAEKAILSLDGPDLESLRTF
jgi:hypothetical protein